MGGTFNREDNIRGRAIFVLEPGLLGDRDQVRNVKNESPPPNRMMMMIWLCTSYGRKSLTRTSISFAVA